MGAQRGMNPLVRDLFKRILIVGRDYPGGLDLVKRKTREMVAKNASLTSESDIKRAVHAGRWWVKEMMAVAQLRKYRVLRKRYGAEGEASAEQVEAARRRLEQSAADALAGKPVDMSQ